MRGKWKIKQDDESMKQFSYFGYCTKYFPFFCAVGGGMFLPHYLWLGWSSCRVINNDLIHPSPRVLEPAGGKQGGLT